MGRYLSFRLRSGTALQRRKHPAETEKLAVPCLRFELAEKDTNILVRASTDKPPTGKSCRCKRPKTPDRQHRHQREDRVAVVPNGPLDGTSSSAAMELEFQKITRPGNQ